MQYLIDDKGKKTGVLLSMKEWEKIQKKLKSEAYYKSFRVAIQEIKEDVNKSAPLKDASTLFH
ncbi:MAG: hypothetical protein EBZ77_01030 [Chitinophagia bacterium]|nr:hypothetical protein [Chitinophagia bacterium]